MVEEAGGLEAIPSNILLFGNSKRYAYGYLDPAHSIEYTEGREAHAKYKGYFILDKQNGERLFGLGETEWNRELQVRGIFNPDLEKTGDSQ